MEGFKLWLHPINWKASPVPVRIKELQHASSHDERIAVVREVCAMASTYSIDADNLAEVAIHPDRLVVSSEQASGSITLPLGLAQIDHYDILESTVQRSDSALGFLAYRYPMQEHRAPWRETENEIPSSAPGDVWVFVVTADRRFRSDVIESCSVLSQAIKVLVRNGAISGDINIFEHATERVVTGGFGSVQFLRYKHGNDSRTYAGKFLVGEKASALACAESQYLLAAGNHPHIVAFCGVYCFVTPAQECKWMILMEAHVGGDMEGRVRHLGAFSECASLEVSKDVLRALSHLHGLGIIHRDVKPGNVVQASDGRAVLIDVGLAVHVSESAKRKKLCGSPGFTAPEIYQRRECEPKSDVFGCGALLYFVASGRGPFAASNKDETNSLNKRACVSFDDRHFLTLRWQTIEIMRLMLQKKVRRRPSALYALEAVTLIMDTIPPVTLPGTTAHASGHVLSEPGEPMHQESNPTRESRWTRPQGMFSDLKSSEVPSCSCSSSSSSSSSSLSLHAARQKLSAGPAVQKIVNSERRLKNLFARVKGTTAQVQPYEGEAMQ